MKKLVKFIIAAIAMTVLAAIAVFSYRYFSNQKFIDTLKNSQFYQSENDANYVSIYKNHPELDSDIIVLMGNNGIVEMDQRMLKISSEQEFDQSRFIRYYNYFQANDDKNLTVDYKQCLKVVNKDVDLYEPLSRDGIMEIMDDPDFDVTKVHRYLNLFVDYPSEKVVDLVNNDIDLVPVSIEQYQTVLNLFDERYFIKGYLKRYLDYATSHNNLELKEVVKRVNSNIDQAFFNDDKPTDLSKGILLICNKYNKLASDYVPDNLVTISSKYSDSGARLVKEAAEAFEFMCQDAKNYGQNIEAYGDNGYRSYGYQQSLYNFYADAYGISGADEISARPGYSEHQSGLAIDVMVNGSKYNTNHQLDWLMENSYQYGFIYRYQGQQEYITGYQMEQWHYRYVGKDVAKKIHDEGITFEEYYAYYVLDHTITTEQFVETFQ